MTLAEVTKLYCKHCQEDHPQTAEHWYRNGIYFKCRHYYRERARIRWRLKRIEMDAQWHRQKDLAAQARVPKHFAPVVRDVLWTPLDWKETCQRLAGLCSPGTRSFLFHLSHQESLSKKQWDVFKRIHREKIGRLKTRMLATRPSRPWSKPQNVQVEPGMVTRYKMKQTGQSNVLTDQDGFVSQLRPGRKRYLSGAKTPQVDEDGYLCR